MGEEDSRAQGVVKAIRQLVDDANALPQEPAQSSLASDIARIRQLLEKWDREGLPMQRFCVSASEVHPLEARQFPLDPLLAAALQPARAPSAPSAGTAASGGPDLSSALDG